jgi:hypothetical protein
MNWSENQSIIDLIITITPFLKCYKDYAKIYNEATKSINFFKQEENLKPSKKYDHETRKKVFEILDSKHPIIQQTQIDSLLIQPIQRLPRYELLLKLLEENTPPNHPDFPICGKAYESMKKVVEETNTTLKSTEFRDHCIRINEFFAGQLPWKNLPITTIVEAHRYFIQENCLSNNMKVFLFNDLLILATQSLISREKMTINNIYFLSNIEIKEKDDKTITVLDSTTNEKQKITFSNFREKSDWVLVVENSIDEEKRRKNTIESRKSD